MPVGRGPESTFRHSLKSSEPEKYHGQATPAGLDREGSSSDHGRWGRATKGRWKRLGAGVPTRERGKSRLGCNRGPLARH